MLFDNDYVGAFCEFINESLFQTHDSFRTCTAHFFAGYIRYGVFIRHTEIGMFC